MNILVKITALESGEPVEDAKWCLLLAIGDTARTVCTGDAIDGSSHYEHQIKTVKRGGITCEDCIQTVKIFKEIKL